MEEDCSGGFNIFNAYSTWFLDSCSMADDLSHLYHCGNQSGKVGKASQVKSQMNSKYPNSNLTTIVATVKDPKSKGNEEATKTYENIYDLFIEGKFDEAVAQKKMADSLYG